MENKLFNYFKNYLVKQAKKDFEKEIKKVEKKAYKHFDIIINLLDKSRIQNLGNDQKKY